MFARFTTVRGDPNRIESVVDEVDGATRAAVEATPGNRGFAVLTDIPGGRILGASYWESAAAMRSSETALAASRESAATGLGGDVGIESFELALGFRHTIPARGALVRLTRSRIEPARVEAGIALTQEEILPKVKGAIGLCSFQLLVDRESGSGLTVTAWENAAAVQAFAPIAEQLRARAGDRVGTVFEQPENWVLVRTTVQLN